MVNFATPVADDFRTVNQLIEADRPYIFILDKLVSPTDKLLSVDRAGSARGFSAGTVLSLKTILSRFDALAGDMPSFSTQHVATFACVSPVTIKEWAERGLLRPVAHASGRGRETQYPRFEMFLAVCYGALRRRDVPLETLTAVSALLRGEQQLTREAKA